MITSSHFTSVPFRILLIGLITSLETSGRLPCTDVLEKLNVVLLIINDATLFTTDMDERVRAYVLVTSFSMLGLVYHRRKVPVVEHISSRCPPEHTDKIPESDCVAIPATGTASIHYNLSRSYYTNCLLIASSCSDQILISLLTVS